MLPLPHILEKLGCSPTVGDKTVVKAPDWVYVPSVKPLPPGEIRHSYTPHAEGENPTIVMEFISATEGTEYSINPHYPYGKWYFYEQILQVPTYVIFHPQIPILEVHNLVNGKYEQQSPDENQRFWMESLNLFLGMWKGKKAEFEGHWLRWWDKSGNLLPWGVELVAQERQWAEQAEQKAVRLAQRLQAMGIDPEEI